jgi:uncharacterized protein YkwD
MKSAVFMSAPVLLLLFVHCHFQREVKPAASNRTVRIIRHSDLPIEFDSRIRNRETRQFLVLLNRYRRQEGLNPLRMDEKLQRAAQWMSDDMAAEDYLSHRDSRGRDPFERMAAFGYDYNTDKAENVAAGQRTAAEVLQSWQSSKTHSRNMLDPHFTVIGIGFSYTRNSKYGWYWATSFGGQRSR